MDYLVFFDWYAFLKKSVGALKEILQEMDAKAPLRKSFNREIRCQEKKLASEAKKFAKVFPGTEKAWRRLESNVVSLLLKNLAVHHELCAMVAGKLAAVFPSGYYAAGPLQRKLWLDVIGQKVFCAYVVEHIGVDRNIGKMADVLRHEAETDAEVRKAVAQILKILSEAGDCGKPEQEII